EARVTRGYDPSPPRCVAWPHCRSRSRAPTSDGVCAARLAFVVPATVSASTFADSHSVDRLQGRVGKVPGGVGCHVDVEGKLADVDDVAAVRSLEHDPIAGAGPAGPPKPPPVRRVVVDV